MAPSQWGESLNDWGSANHKLPNISVHLSDAELVEVQAVANRRIYKLRYEAFQELDAWLESFRRVWDDKLDRLVDYLQELQGKEVKTISKSAESIRS